MKEEEETADGKPKKQVLMRVILPKMKKQLRNACPFPAEIVFRLKEKGAGEWFYESPYFFEQATPSHLFPFGFPIIEDSEGKTYLVEIEGRGEPNGETPGLYVFAAADRAGRPYLYSRYVYRRENLKKDWQPIFKNTLAKIGLSFKKETFLFAFFFSFWGGNIFLGAKTKSVF